MRLHCRFRRVVWLTGQDDIHTLPELSMQQKSRRTLLKATPAVLLFPTIVRAREAWPTRPIRCVVPLPPGGGTDAVARLAMQHLSEALGVPVVVDNKPGAGGTIGSDMVAHAAPDGYTVGIATSSSHAAAPVFRKDLPYDPVTSFTAVTLLGTTPYILIGGPSAGAKDLPAFIAAAKTQPGKLVCASLGVSTLGYLLTRKFELIAGIDLIDAPYKGSGQAYPDLMNGTVAVMLDNPSGSAGLVREGRLTAFAVTQPSATLPDVPTFDSFGIKPFDDVFWYGLVAPARMPSEIAERMQQVLAQGFLSDPGRSKMRNLDVTPVVSTPKAFAETMARDTRKWRDLADRLGIKPE
ncbi:MAG: tripartite tricarboxylate transporter substrate binding protein [Proteobacteria bacterium]|nr:tripartite tricarboxylate transporter substrate binding protein [Pseudomonadota bacterium]